MGGTIALLAEQGHNILLLDITDGSPTPHGDRATRLPEAEAARKALCPPQHLIDAGKAFPVKRLLLDLPNRMVEHTVENRHKVAGVYRAHQAQIIFAPHWEDAHPDHLAVTKIAADARFDAKLTKIDMPRPRPAIRRSARRSIRAGASTTTPRTSAAPPTRPSSSTPPATTPRSSDPSTRIKPSSQATPSTLTSPPSSPRTTATSAGLSGATFGEPFTSKEPLGLTGLSAPASSEALFTRP
jgi:LmbE family N-acetylglucosaminyl deacetylase